MTRGVKTAPCCRSGARKYSAVLFSWPQGATHPRREDRSQRSLETFRARRGMLKETILPGTMKLRKVSNLGTIAKGLRVLVLKSTNRKIPPIFKKSAVPKMMG